jgi:uncharacterized protein YbjT (DUF2867 family)
MRLLILGASGGCGRWATRLAAEQGHQVTALVRPQTPFEPPTGVTVRRGNPLDPSELRAAAAGQDAVISCIGPQRSNPRNPWSPLRPPLAVAELSAGAAVAAVDGSPARRFACISAAGVGDSATAMNGVMRWLVRHTTIGAMYADLDAMEQVLRHSRLDWVAVRPVTLVNAAPSSRTRVLGRYRTMSVVGRADVAAWLLRVATDPAPVQIRTPMIGWW